MALLRLLSSLRLSIALLLLAMALVYAGTWAQVDAGIYQVQRDYFHAWVTHIPLGTILPRTSGGELLIPGATLFPGGYTIGLLMLVNLLANWFTRFRWGWKQAGTHLVHLGIVMLLVGEAWTSIAQVDARMVIHEGQ